MCFREPIPHSRPWPRFLCTKGQSQLFSLNNGVSFGCQRSVQTVSKADSPDGKLLMAKQNVSQRPKSASVAADPQTVNPRATSIAATPDPSQKAFLVWSFDFPDHLPQLTLHVEPWLLKRAPRLRLSRRNRDHLLFSQFEEQIGPKSCCSSSSRPLAFHVLPGARRPPGPRVALG
jgi:hypothetical protein